MEKRIVVVGGGFAGLSAAALLANKGNRVTLLEKNEELGGRARLWETDGFTFDMGPSWYLMPEVFDDFFALFSRQTSDYYRLERLDPYYRVFFGQEDYRDITADLEHTKLTFDAFEKNGGAKLEEYLKSAAYKYRVALDEFLYRDYTNVFQFLNKKMLREGLRLNVLQHMDAFVRRYFTDRRARQILEYTMVFLGTSPQKAPALYSIMSHVDLDLGVFYPQGGLGAVAQALAALAEEQGAEIVTGADVDSILTNGKESEGVTVDGKRYPADAVLYAGDYPYAETELLSDRARSFSPSYWGRKVLSPSMFILYLGYDRRLKNLEHHNLYFEHDWSRHFDMIFKRPRWPEAPCFYLSAITKSDPRMAPEGGENIFILVPIAAGLDDSDEQRERYAQHVLEHVSRITGEDMQHGITVRRIFSGRDFEQDYHAYRGTALSIAHTLFQTAVFRPPHRSKKVENLFYTGHYTHPGVGVPMTLIASRIVADLMEQSPAGGR
jgi:phytoene desaturase